MKTKLLLILFTGIIGLSKAQVAELWGMTAYGGAYGAGAIYKTDHNGNHQETVYSFPKSTGSYPIYTHLCDAGNGKLYGMTCNSESGMGEIFEYNPLTASYATKHAFDSVGGGHPSGSLMKAANGKLYGMTRNGGIYGNGVIFEYDVMTNTYTKKVDFQNSVTGGSPTGNLVQANSGKLYGMTSYGGSNNKGVVFEYLPSTNTYTKKIDFDGTTNGANPTGSLIISSNGTCFGMTSSGGANAHGTLFSYIVTTNILSKKVDFDGLSKGANPYGALVEASNGKLYGMAKNGGSNNKGVVFEYNATTNTYTKKIDFDGATNGANPSGTLIQASNAKLYGMTTNGGSNGNGVVFDYDITTNVLTKRVDFDNQLKGAAPQGSLMQLANGKLYGLTSEGGTMYGGVLFDYDISTNTFSKKINLREALNGANPNGALLLVGDNKLYGMTARGGANNFGVLFVYDITEKTFTKKIDFDNTNTGAYPLGALIKSNHGTLYGMSSDGGVFGKGVLFEYDTASSICTKKIDFTDTLGARPYGSPFMAQNGKVYGLTSGGGANSEGVLFEYNPTTKTYAKKFDFSSSNGQAPQGTLMQASNGLLYGVTPFGGQYGLGVLFEYNYTTNSYTKKIDFDNSSYVPSNGMIETKNHKLYGVTNLGSSTGGSLFEYDLLTQTYTKKVTFQTKDVHYAIGPLLQASNNKLYGTAQYNSTNSGALFEYDMVTGSLVLKSAFNIPQGARSPESNNSLIEVGRCTYTTTSTDTACDRYSYKGKTYTTSGIYIDTMYSSTGCDTVYELNLTIKKSTSAAIAMNACHEYTWPLTNSKYTSSGNYTTTIANQAGCDSVITLNLIITSINTSVYNDNGTLEALEGGSATYQWLKCDSFFTPIPGATAQRFTLTDSGSYAVKIEKKGCTDTSACYSFTTTAVKTNAFANLRIAPNPTQGSMLIDFGGLKEEITITIIDNIGRQVICTTERNQSQIQLNLAIPAGIYYLIVRSADGAMAQHIIVKE